MGKPTTVVFDVGNVLLRWDPRHLYRTHLRRRGADGVVPRQCLHARLESRAGPGPRLGRGGGASRRRIIRRTRPHIRAFHERWDETVSGVVRGPCRPAAAPARGGRAELLHHQFLRPEIRAVAGSATRSSSGFDGIVVSGDERLLKPDPAIYRSAARPLRPQGGGLRLHRRFEGQCGRGPRGGHARDPFRRADGSRRGTAGVWVSGLNTTLELPMSSPALCR